MRGARMVVGLALAALAWRRRLRRRPRSTCAFSASRGSPSPGTPAKYNKVGILEVGPKRAKNILVLNPGTSASAAYFAPLAKTIVPAPRAGRSGRSSGARTCSRTTRCSTARSAAGLTPRRSSTTTWAGSTIDSIEPALPARSPTPTSGFARDWGMRVEMEDLHRVVKRAHRRGGRVVLGGHSLGGTMTTAYADLGLQGQGRGRDLSGPGLHRRRIAPRPLLNRRGPQRLQELEAGSPWLAFGGIPSPLTGLFNTVGLPERPGDPDARSIGQQFPLLPANLKPPVPATNAAQYGYALDTETSPPSLAAAQAHLGRLADSGDPRGWVRDGELTPDSPLRQGVLRLGPAQPRRHRLVPPAAPDDRWRRRGGRKRQPGAAGARCPRHPRRRSSAPAADLRLRRALGGSRVLDAARLLAQQSGIPRRRLTLVNRAGTYSHNDPNSAAPAQRLRGPPGPVPQADREPLRGRRRSTPGSNGCRRGCTGSRRR